MKLLAFKASWCTPCKALSKTIEETDLPFEVTSVNIDEDIDTAMKYGVRSVPTLVLIDSYGNELKRHSGIVSSKELVDKFVEN